MLRARATDGPARFESYSRAVPGIERIHIKSFGCIEDVELELGPLQAFIGPNDSGKSTILRAVEVAVEVASKKIDGIQEPRSRHGASLEIDVGGERLNLQCSVSGILERPKTVNPEALWKIAAALRGGTALIRLDPDALRAPSQLIPEGQELGFITDRGAGLAGLFDALINRSDRPVDAITARVRERFPTVKHIGLRNVSTTHKELQLELVDGSKIPASMASEGLLYYLAFATLPYLHATASILLIEEPENGLHPARIRDVVATLREISKTTQILIATHSPILVNELQPHEVFVTTRDPKTGTRVVRLDRTPNFAERARVYNPGELWVAYADGDTEAALLGEDDA
jgi:predicted ATPase